MAAEPRDEPKPGQARTTIANRKVIRTIGAKKLRSELLACANNGTLDCALQGLVAEDLDRLLHDWQLWARDDQLPFATANNGAAWRTWVILGGRGAGKTRAGAEWVRAQALGLEPLGKRVSRRIALIGETLADVRSVMVEGVSGLMAIHRKDERPKFEPSKRQLVWPNGAIAQMFSADDPESLRGPQFAAAWCDELCKWRHPDLTWDMLQFGLRLGAMPRQVVTTTPRPIALLRRLIDDPFAIVTKARTEDNAANLSAAFLTAVNDRYQGSALGRQELDGEIIEDVPDALWQFGCLDRCRVNISPELNRIVVAVDPPVTSGPKSDACGIVVAGLSDDGRGYILADRTVQGIEPLGWARAAVAAYHVFEADKLVAEVNQGGELVRSIIEQVDASVPVKMVRATRGKWLRAEPVAALYGRGLVSHVGVMKELESQMVTFRHDGLAGSTSPDRLDALVWALTELMLTDARSPRIRNI